MLKFLLNVSKFYWVSICISYCTIFCKTNLFMYYILLHIAFTSPFPNRSYIKRLRETLLFPSAVKWRNEHVYLWRQTLASLRLPDALPRCPPAPTATTLTAAVAAPPTRPAAASTHSSSSSSRKKKKKKRRKMVKSLAGAAPISRLGSKHPRRTRARARRIQRRSKWGYYWNMRLSFIIKSSLMS